MEESTWFRKTQYRGTLTGLRSALRDPAQRLHLLKEVEKRSSENIDAILELAKQGRIEKAWTQMADTLNQIARDKFRRTTSAVPPEIKEATTRRREALRQIQTCREALAATCLMSSKLDLAWTTWVSVHRLRLASKCVRLLVQTAASAHRAQLCFELQEAWEARSLVNVAIGSEAWRKEKWSEKKILQRATIESDPVVRTGKIFCAVHVKMGDVKESKQSGHPRTSGIAK